MHTHSNDGEEKRTNTNTSTTKYNHTHFNGDAKNAQTHAQTHNSTVTTKTQKLQRRRRKKWSYVCCLMQESRPLSFASRSLTEAKVNYAQIYEEFLEIVFACENFIYGRKIKVMTIGEYNGQGIRKNFICKIAKNDIEN